MVLLSSCVCHRHVTPFHCVSCFDRSSSDSARPAHPQQLAVAWSLHFDPAHLRSGSSPEEAYARSVRALHVGHAALRLVNSTLPTHVLLSGWHDPGVLEDLRRRGLRLHRHPSPPVPQWAKLWYRGHFSKLNALHFAARLRSHVLFLDSDVLAFRNFDRQLSGAPAPAFVFRDYGGNFHASGSGLNSGVMLLPPLPPSQLDAALSLFRAHLTAPFAAGMVGQNGGDQSFWNAWLQSRRPAVHELSARYNTYTDEIRTNETGWWRGVVLWHKPLEKGLGRMHPEGRRYVEAHVARAKALAGARPATLPRQAAAQPLRWCDGERLRELFVSVPPVPTQGTLREASTQQVQATLAECKRACAQRAGGTRWVSVCLQLDACTCHSACSQLRVGPRAGGGNFRLRTTWTEEPAAWFAEPVV